MSEEIKEGLNVEEDSSAQRDLDSEESTATSTETDSSFGLEDLPVESVGSYGRIDESADLSPMDEAGDHKE